MTVNTEIMCLSIVVMVANRESVKKTKLVRPLSVKSSLHERVINQNKTQSLSAFFSNIP